MNLKKIIASVAAASIAVTSMATISASALTAGATSIDFEDGDYSFVYMNTDSGADASVLSVEDYNGSKALKVDIQDKTMVPKVWFDLDKIMDRSSTVGIKSVSFDIAIAPKNAEDTVGWCGGAIGAAGGFDLAVGGASQKDPAWSQATWEGGAYNPGEVATATITKKFLMAAEQYTEKGVNPFVGIMMWAAEVDRVMYIDNVQFFDKDGKNITVGVTAAEAPAETEAPAAGPAPEADTTTAPVATGNVAAASIAAVMALAGAAALVAKKRN